MEGLTSRQPSDQHSEREHEVRAGRGSPDPARVADRRSPSFGVCTDSTNSFIKPGPQMGAGDLSVGRSGGVGVATVAGFAGESGYGPCTHGPYPNTGDPRQRGPAQQRGSPSHSRHQKPTAT